MELRGYQQKALENTAGVLRRCASALIVMATGLGKTVIFSSVIRMMLSYGRCMVIAHREELITQACQKIEAVTGVTPEIEMADSYASRLMKPKVVVGTVQTLYRGRMEDFDPSEFSLLVIDEAHHATAGTYLRIIKHFRQNPNCKVLGVTATPDRADETALGKVFDDVAYSYGIQEGIDDGWLVPVMQNQVFVKSLDLSRIKTRMGDLAENELSSILEFEANLHGIADPTLEIAGDRKTLIFAGSVAQAERLAEIFNRHKPRSATFVTGKTPKETRRRIFAEYSRGEIQFLCNVGVATEGFDEPGIEVVAMARPTKSRCLYTQMAGRGTRPAEEIAYTLNNVLDAGARREMIRQSSKPSVEIIDFVGNAGRHKLVNSADILGGKYPDEVVDLAKEAVEEAAQKGKPTEIISELKRCENELAKRRRMAAEAKLREHIRLKAEFVTQNVDPFDRYGIIPQRIPAWHRDREASHKQVQFLERRGVDATEMNFVHASQLIGEIKRKEDDAGVMTFGKHTGKPIEKLPKGYTDWLLCQEWLKDGLREKVEHRYQQRGWDVPQKVEVA